MDVYDLFIMGWLHEDGEGTGTVSVASDVVAPA